MRFKQLLPCIAVLSVRRRVYGIVVGTVLGWLGIELRESLDQRIGFGRARTGGVACCMVPGQDSDSCFGESRAYRFDHRLHSELGPGTKVQDPILQSARRRGFVNERPAAIENRGTESFRNIEHGQTRRAECCDQQHELKIRHLGAMSIKCLHDRSLSLSGGGKAWSDEASVTAGCA